MPQLNTTYSIPVQVFFFNTDKRIIVINVDITESINSELIRCTNPFQDWMYISVEDIEVDPVARYMKQQALAQLRTLLPDLHISREYPMALKIYNRKLKGWKVPDWAK